MKSIILTSTVRFITPFLLVIAVFLLLRGHNEPGGGFAGGLVAAAALALQMFAFGEATMRSMIRIDARIMAGIGLVLTLASGLPGLLSGDGFLKAIWLTIPTPFGSAKIGTPLAFDIGVFFVVLGVTVSFLEDMHTE
ncbi:MnhB domain-containing protein [Kamptonema cortianum]|nr:MnhB domain-containing protein [Geitlerinema splendidum]MDK3158494.1 MnhB domain-containing protein [Kamptonema cortianum]